jgi:membrane protein GlpM
MDIVWKALIGAAVTALIAWAAKQGDILPGIVPLFPTFTLIALAAVGTKGDPHGFQQTCVAAMKTFPALVAFLLVNYLLVPRLGFKVTLVAALVVWLIVVGVMFAGPKLYHH